MVTTVFSFFCLRFLFLFDVYVCFSLHVFFGFAYDAPRPPFSGRFVLLFCPFFFLILFCRFLSSFSTPIFSGRFFLAFPWTSCFLSPLFVFPIFRLLFSSLSPLIFRFFFNPSPSTYPRRTTGALEPERLLLHGSR